MAGHCDLNCHCEDRIGRRSPDDLAGLANKEESFRDFCRILNMKKTRSKTEAELWKWNWAKSTAQLRGIREIREKDLKFRFHSGVALCNRAEKAETDHVSRNPWR
jgi:hypothetical protein